MSDKELAALRAEAASSGSGSFIRLDNKGEWASGTVVRREIDTAPFGEVEQLILIGVRTHEGDRDPTAEISFRLSRSVLKREYGSDAEDGGAVAGMFIYCEAQGEAMSKNGKPYFKYDCIKKNKKDLAESVKAHPDAVAPVQVPHDIEAAKAALASLGATDDDGDLPF